MKNEKIEFNLIRKIAWSFHHTTGHDYDELYAEASLAYCEAMDDWCPDRGTKFTTYAYTRMRYALSGYVRGLQKPMDFEMPEIGSYNTPFWEIEETLSESAQIIVDHIFSNPHAYLQERGQARRAKLRRVVVGSGAMKDWQFFQACKEIRAIC